MKKLMVLAGFVFLCGLLVTGCAKVIMQEHIQTEEANVVETESELKKVVEVDLFEPEDGEVHLFIGQDLESVGGLIGYEGYVDYFGMPAGVTTYVGISDMDGLTKFTNYGAGDVHARAYMDDPRFEDTWMAIGLYMAGDLETTIAGDYDQHLEELADFITEYKNPVFLRIGYEFNYGGNNYDPDLYIEAYQYVCDYLDAKDVHNYVSVWQSFERGRKSELIAWYPGDDYVDWVGYSYFNQHPDLIGQGMLEIAREKGKPAMIAEATPRVDIFLEDNETVWSDWYEPFFQHIHDNQDVIRAVSYINCRWRTQAMWIGGGWGDSRVQLTDYYAQRWIEEMQSGIWNYQKLETTVKSYERKVADAYPKGTMIPGVGMEGAYEAELAVSHGNVDSYEDAVASGGNAVAGLEEEGDRIDFVDMPETEDLWLRYAANVEELTEGETMFGTIGFYIDGVRMRDHFFKSTSSWDGNYVIEEINIDINKGSIFSIGFEQGDTPIHIDCIVP